MPVSKSARKVAAVKQPKTKMAKVLPAPKQFNVVINEPDYDPFDGSINIEEGWLYVVEAKSSAQAAYIAAKVFEELHPKETLDTITIDERDKDARLLFIPFVDAATPPPLPPVGAVPALPVQ